MSKKIIIGIVVATLVFVCVFSACNKGVYTNPASGKDYNLVTDENGGIVRSDDGELLVYATDENGELQKDENGELVTEVQGFIGQIENNGIVEDYSYTVTLPKGWKTADEKGVFVNENKSATLSVSIMEYFYNDYYAVNKNTYDTFASDSENGKTFSVKWDEEFKVENIDTASPFFSLNTENETLSMVFFEQGGNLYKIHLQSGDGIEEAESLIKEFVSSMTFKDYVYYDDITHVPTTEAE